jgi:hypothetical protein
MHWAFWRPREPEPFLPAYVQPNRSRWFSHRQSNSRSHAQTQAQARAPHLARGVQTGYYYTYPPPGFGGYDTYGQNQPGYGYGIYGWDQGQGQVQGQRPAPPVTMSGRAGRGRGKKRGVRFGPATVRVVR